MEAQANAVESVGDFFEAVLVHASLSPRDAARGLHSVFIHTLFLLVIGARRTLFEPRAQIVPFSSRHRDRLSSYIAVVPR